MHFGDQNEVECKVKWWNEKMMRGRAVNLAVINHQTRECVPSIYSYLYWGMFPREDNGDAIYLIPLLQPCKTQRAGQVGMMWQAAH
jgi:hypothetical protein